MKTSSAIHNLPAVLAALLALFAAGFGCSTYTLPGAIGEQCDLNSDCDAPLVCRFGYCRVECGSARDCARGFDCILDNDKRGACQLETDLGCTLNSDCVTGLFCTMGECTNECSCAPDDVPCRDCAPGAVCVTADDGTPACFDDADDTCVYNSDCPPTPDDPAATAEICAPDQRCRLACTIGGDDCRNGEICQVVTFDLDGTPAMGPFCVFTNPTMSAMP